VRGLALNSTYDVHVDLQKYFVISLGLINIISDKSDNIIDETTERIGLLSGR